MGVITQSAELLKKYKNATDVSEARRALPEGFGYMGSGDPRKPSENASAGFLGAF
jgi:hypothetical protein